MEPGAVQETWGVRGRGWAERPSRHTGRRLEAPIHAHPHSHTDTPAMPWPYDMIIEPSVSLP